MHFFYVTISEQPLIRKNWTISTLTFVLRDGTIVPKEYFKHFNSYIYAFLDFSDLANTTLRRSLAYPGKHHSHSGGPQPTPIATTVHWWSSAC